MSVHMTLDVCRDIRPKTSHFGQCSSLLSCARLGFELPRCHKMGSRRGESCRGRETGAMWQIGVLTCGTARILAMAILRPFLGF